MGPKPETFRRNICLLAGLAIVARLVIGAVSWRELQRLDDDAGRMARGQETLAALASVRSDLASAEAAEAAYLLTGDDAELSRFKQDERDARRHLAHAWTLAADETAVGARLSDAARLIDQRFQLSGIAQGARRHGLDLARARVVLKVGRDATAKAVAAADQASLAETTLLQARAEAHRKALSRALSGIARVALFSIIILILFALWILPVFDERLADRRALRPAPSPSRAR